MRGRAEVAKTKHMGVKIKNRPVNNEFAYAMARKGRRESRRDKVNQCVERGKKHFRGKDRKKRFKVETRGPVPSLYNNH